MKIIYTFLFALISLQISAQLNRYPYIQSTTQNSTIIAWKTANSVVGKVAYGLSPNALTDTLEETSASTRHALTLRGLEQNTEYFYSIFSANTPLASEYFFTASDSTDQEFSFIHYGDCGYNNSEQATIGALMEADDANFAVICGDIDQGGVPHISSAQGGDDYDEIFFDVYNNGTTTKMLSRECHYPAIGNHDTYADNGATYELEFHLPHNNIDSSERYYSYTWGDALFIALDVITPFDPTTFPINQAPLDQRYWTDFRQSSAQYDFLVNELQCNDKKWVFVYFHEGPWTNYWGPDYNLPNAIGGDYYQYEGNTMVRQHLVPVFEQYAVDFVLVGHSHLYEQAEKNGVWYITSGGAGDVGGNTQYGNNPEILKTIIDNLYVKFSVDNNTVSYDVINDNNTVIDTFSLTKNYTEYQVNAAITNVSCFGLNDGEITLNIQGPKGPYTVEWFDGSSGLTKSNLSADTLYAYVRNTYGCEKVSSFIITEPPLIVPTILTSNNNFSFCEDDSISLTTANSYAAYNWSNGATSSFISVNQEGNIGLMVTDTNGCSGNASTVQVTTIDLPNATFGFASNDSSYNFQSIDPTGTNYYWDFGDGTLDTTTSFLTNHIYQTNGTFDVVLVLENTCASDEFTLITEVSSYTETGIRDYFIKEALTIQPNPFQDYTEITVTGLGENLTVETYNLIGELISSENKSSSKFIIRKNNLSEGTYYVKVKNEKGQFTLAKIMIN